MPSWSPFQPPKPRVSKLKAKPAKPVGTTAAKTPVVNDLPPHPAADTPVPTYGGGKVKPAVKKTKVNAGSSVDPVEALLAQLVKGSGVNARQTVQNQLAPFMAQFQAGLHQQATSEAQRRAALQGFTASLMKVLQGDVAGVQSDYANAESQIGALSSAASQSFAAQNPNAQDQALLQAVNAPTGQQAALAGQNQSLFGQGANTLAYLGGTLPRENLTQAGLAQLAYTRGLPGIAALSGEQAFKQQLQAFSTERQKLQGQRASVLAQIPGLVQKVQAQNQAQRVAAINSLLGYRSRQQTLGLQRSVAEANASAKQQALALEAGALGIKQSSLNLSAKKVQAGIDAKAIDQEIARQGLSLKVANAKIAAANKDRNYGLALSRLGISEQSLKLRAVALQYKMDHPRQKGGFTSSQLLKMRSKAVEFARVYHDGGILTEQRMVQNKNGTSSLRSVQVQYNPGEVTYQEAFQTMIEHNIAPSVAYNKLNGYYQPGENGRPGQSAGYRNPLKINWGSLGVPYGPHTGLR